MEIVLFSLSIGRAILLMERPSLSGQVMAHAGYRVSIYNFIMGVSSWFIKVRDKELKDDSSCHTIAVAKPMCHFTIGRA